MADISIDEAKAQEWILDVKNELSQVEQILQKVSKVCTTTPAETDDILKGMAQAGNDLQNHWNNMCSGFKSATTSIENAIKNLTKATEKVMSNIDSIRSKIGH